MPHPVPQPAPSLPSATRPAASQRSPQQLQRGDFLVNLAIALAIGAVLAVIGIPAFRGIAIEGRTPQVAAELQRFMARLSVMGEAGANLPYAGVSNAVNLAPALRGSTALRVTDSVVKHNLGGAGTGASGVVTLAPDNLDAAGAGSAYSLTLTDVHDKACPTLASILASASELITINGQTVKSTTTAYNAPSAQAHCLSGENNDFVFVAR